MIILLVCLLVMAAAPAVAADTGGVPASRLPRLTRGVNLGAFRYRPDTTITPDLVKTLKASGFRHVRLPVLPDTLIDEARPETLRPDGLKRLDGMIDVLLANKLAVIVDMHDPDKRLWNDTGYAEKFTVFWEALARHLSARDPGWVFLEVANEPLSDTPEHWNALQGRLIAAIRKGAPRHTIVATPNMQIKAGWWDQRKALDTLAPYPDRNVVYTFHYYDPFFFTHQGATWSMDIVKPMRGVPYPSSPERVAPAMEGMPDDVRGGLVNYGKERWDAAKVKAGIDSYVAWAKRHNVPLTCNEFGVLRTVAPEADRLVWLSDVRKALEKAKVGWTMWDDGGGFGVTQWIDGAWRFDTGALKAMELKAPAR